MKQGRHLVSIWFFIGVLLLVYGIIILCSGIYGLVSPSRREVVMGHLHAEIWWGALLVVLGAVYARVNSPGRDR